MDLKKTIVILVLAVVLMIVIINQSKGTPQIADSVKIETIKGDIVELQGKSMFYKDKYGNYPIIPESIYDNPDADVVWATQVFERFFSKNFDSLEETEDYIAENIKLIDFKEMKSKGITYELANKKSKYYIDTKSGVVLSPDLIEEGDEDYLAELEDSTGQYKVGKEFIEIRETQNPNNVMVKVNGSYKSGATIYFYGEGSMKYARRNEATNEIVNLDNELLDLNIDGILYIQPNTGRAAVKVGGNVKVIQLLNN